MIKLESLSDLQEAVKTWLNRNDSATVKALPSFIFLAENDFDRLLKLPEYETLKVYHVGTDTDVSTVTSAINLPDDFDEVKALLLNGKPAFIQSNEAFYEHNGETLPAFTKIGSQLILKPALKDGDVITLIYYKPLAHAQNIADTPPHIKKGPDVMLYLSLRHAALFLRDNDMGQYWEQKAQEAVTGLQAKIEGERWNGSTIVIPGK